MDSGVPLLAAIAFGIWKWEPLYIVFLAALAAATADTWGTEIGSWSRREPRNIVTWRPVPKGASGAVSLIGTAGSLAGAGSLAVLGVLLLPKIVGLADWVAVTAIGFTAALVDSILGATKQARFLKPGSDEITEIAVSQGQKLELYGGWRWLDNNMVNLVCTSSGAALAAIWLLI